MSSSRGAERSVECATDEEPVDYYQRPGTVRSDVVIEVDGAQSIRTLLSHHSSIFIPLLSDLSEELIIAVT
jgi:hypothetical protein